MAFIAPRLHDPQDEDETRLREQSELLIEGLRQVCDITIYLSGLTQETHKQLSVDCSQGRSFDLIITETPADRSYFMTVWDAGGQATKTPKFLERVHYWASRDSLELIVGLRRFSPRTVLAAYTAHHDNNQPSGILMDHGITHVQRMRCMYPDIHGPKDHLDFFKAIISGRIQVPVRTLDVEKYRHLLPEFKKDDGRTIVEVRGNPGAADASRCIAGLSKACQGFPRGAHLERCDGPVMRVNLKDALDLRAYFAEGGLRHKIIIDGTSRSAESGALRIYCGWNSFINECY
ncbi:hypothetical protein ACFL2T_01005 [Elusimicrobiota bacterium]